MKTQTFTFDNNQETLLAEEAAKTDILVKVSLFAAILTCINLIVFL